jgi:formyltetrahydrofolate-dependent phosphoribosylglycinamide formyltransferase
MEEKSRLVVFASGEGTNLQAILDACADGSLDAEVVALVADKKCNAIKRAEAAGVPIIFHPWGPYKVAGKLRSTYDRDLAARVMMYAPDWVVLAGWMRLLTIGFLEHYPEMVINLHPALPGAFPGTEAIARAFEAYQRGGIAQTGVMVHFVPDEGVDDGPVILSEAVPILPGDTLELLEARVHEVEHRVFVAAIKSLIED